MPDSSSSSIAASLSIDNAALAAWKTVSFPSLQAQLQQSVTTYKQQREAFSLSRKSLVDSTKQFQRHLKEEANIDATVCRDIVKRYQEEIDKLTKRCKSAEQTVASLQQGLCSSNNNTVLPDPAVALQKANDQVQKLLETVETVTQELQTNNNTTQKDQHQQSSADEAEKDQEIHQLRQEVAAYELEFRSLKNQDITIRKLEDKVVELQTNAAQAVEDAVNQVRSEFAHEAAQQAQQTQQELATAHATVERYKKQWQSEQAMKEATQTSLLQADDVVSQREAAWEAQRHLLLEDYQRVQESLQNTLREKDALQQRLMASTTGSAPPSGGQQHELLLERNAYEAEVAELSATNASLRDELRVQASTQSRRLEELRSQVTVLQRERSTLQDTLASLESQLSAAPNPESVATMQRELRILKRLEYNSTDQDMDENPEVVEGDLEAVLVAKLRKADQELIAERNTVLELRETQSTLQAQLETAETAKQEAVQLVATLEKDLETAIAVPKKEKSSSSRVAAASHENPATLQHILDPTATPPPPKHTPASPTTEDEPPAVASIVMAQRDRLRVRCEALEAERDSFKRELQTQVSAAESLKVDNTKLYETVRYLQSNTNSAARNRNVDLEALEERYEASVDPFRQFSRTERQRKLKQMSPMERTVFVVAKTVLSTKEMRTGLFFYVLALHLLVFGTTYHWSGCHHTTVDTMEKLSLIAPHEQVNLIAKSGSGS